jgi:hypothetical protein
MAVQPFNPMWEQSCLPCSEAVLEKPHLNHGKKRHQHRSARIAVAIVH